MAVRTVKQDKATSRRRRPQSAPESTTSVPRSATEPTPAEAYPSAGEQVVNVLKLVADVSILPGTSHLVEGKIKEGILYGLTGLASRIILTPVLGPAVWIPQVLVGLDSFSKSASGRHLWETALPTSEASKSSSTPQQP
jgi:hypothetical protein